jgi:hypothetical protein
VIRIVVAVALLAGCDQLFGFETVAARDAAPFDTVDAIDAPTTDAGQACIGGYYFQVCYFAGDVTNALTVVPASPTTIDTSQDPQCQQLRAGNEGTGEPEACIVIANGIDVSGTLRAIGTRPLVLASSGNISVTGLIDASSHAGAGLPGAGHDTGPCANTVALTGEAQLVGTNHAGGGGGGGLAAAGGAGGRGETTVVAGGGSVDTSFLRGGCSGGDGGASVGGMIARGGFGGGAIYLVAAGTITISGKVIAAGQGGTARVGAAAGVFAGGGGGGAGGTVALDGDMIVVMPSGALIASGGGGGGGANGLMGGTAGGDGLFTGGAAGMGGAGTGGTSNGGAGGLGSTRGSPTGGAGNAGGTTQGGGGGGGGGAGVIHLHANHPPMVLSTTVSPAPS